MSSYIEIPWLFVACKLIIFGAKNLSTKNYQLASYKKAMYFLYQALAEFAYSLHICYVAHSNSNLHVGYLESADRDDH